MSKKKYDIVAVTGTYMKDGEEKKRYQNVGAVIMGDNGPYIILERWFNPAGLPNPDNRDSVFLSLFEPRQQQAPQPQFQQQKEGFDDDIPF